jgi:hypothetical protein
MTADQRLADATADMLFTALANRAAWQEPPELCFLYAAPGSGIRAGRGILTPLTWAAAGDAVRDAIRALTPAIAAAAAIEPTTLIGVMFRGEAWMAPVARSGEPELRPSSHPGRVETRVAAAAIPGAVVTATQPRGMDPALVPGATGALPAALTALREAITANRN